MKRKLVEFEEEKANFNCEERSFAVKKRLKVTELLGALLKKLS